MHDEFQKLQELLEQLTQENNFYKTLLEKNKIFLPTSEVEKSIEQNPAQIEQPLLLSPQQKITLYRSYFRGREDVYAIRWENKLGKSGYSPVCINEWRQPLCQKPKIKCGDCTNQNWKQLATQVIYDHLVGKHLIGIYPLLINDHCYFLALDFDKNTWQSDVVAFAKICEQYELPILIEKSQSGNGAHIWLFFDEAVPASMARSLGTGLLTLTMQNYSHLSFSSYDRLFPNQDTLPTGGFGNLIALPLQGARRKQFGFSTFIDIYNDFLPHADPWQILSNTKKLTLLELIATIKKISATSLILDVPRASDEEESHIKPWEQPPKLPKYPEITECLPNTISVVKANLLFIPTKNLPAKLINQILKIASFQNPEFYRAQAMRLSTFGKPRIINCSEQFDGYIGLPRGCEQELNELLAHYKIDLVFEEQRIKKRLAKIKFTGKLLKAQKEASKAILSHDIGTLSATTGFGKTVLAAHIIAKRKANTLIIVHRQQLLEQWQARLSTFLNISVKEIGVIGGGKHKPNFRIDIAMMQSLIKKDVVHDIVSEYHQIIVDECHHISAFSFEQVLKKSKAFYVLGLTATPIRKDGHQPIIFMQCGPIRYESHNKLNHFSEQHQLIVKIKTTNFMPPPDIKQFAEIYQNLMTNAQRNELILTDVIEAFNNGRNPLLLTERIQHLDWFYEQLTARGYKNVFVLKGGLSKKTRSDIMQKLNEDSGQRILLAIGKYIGEGFDDPKLDTLILALPISWHGTVQQYVGRLHREHHDKNLVMVYDYMDEHSPMLMRMYQKRVKKYQAMGYEINKV